MTDHLPPHPDDEPDALDLLVSRALDDDLSAEERVLLEADADAMARLARMRSARDLVARVDPPSDHVIDAAVAAALSVADEVWPAEVAVSSGGAPTGTVVPFRRRRGWAAAAPWLGAVAAAGALVVGVASLGGGSSDDQVAEKVPEASVAAEERVGGAAESAGDEVVTEMATTAGDANSETGTESGGGSDPEATAMSAPSVEDLPAESAPLESLPVVTEDELAAYATERAVAVVPLCDPTADVLLAQALLGEPPVLVEVLRDGDGIVAYDLVDCTEVARADLG